MRGNITKGILCVLGFVIVPAAETQALPKSRTITYTIYEDPNDNESDIIYTVELDIEASDSDGDSIGWEVLETRITKRNTGSTPDEEWVESYPNVDSLDGLWWIDHVDGNAPDLSEFVIPPLIEGVATPEIPANEDLEYMLEGSVYTPPSIPDQPPFDVTTALSYTFKKAQEQEPDAEADDVPVDTDEDTFDS